MNNKCVNGYLNGLEFDLSGSETKINYKDGYYLKSAIREGDDIVLWVWHHNEEDEHPPITPH
jgi:hypothetical protein